MPQTRQNGIVTPLSSDQYNLPQNLSDMADSANVVIPTANLAARDALTPKEGMVVVRADLAGEMQVYTNGAWKVRPAKGKAGFANGSSHYDELNFSPVWIQELHPAFYYIAGMFKPGTSADGTALVSVALSQAPNQTVNKGVFYRTTGNTYGIAFAQLRPDRFMYFYGLPSTTDYVSLSFGWWGNTTTA